MEVSEKYDPCDISKQMCFNLDFGLFRRSGLFNISDGLLDVPQKNEFLGNIDAIISFTPSYFRWKFDCLVIYKLQILSLRFWNK